MPKHASPAKVVRSYRRLITYLLKRTKPKLSLNILHSIYIPPETKPLDVSKPFLVDIAPVQTVLSIMRQPIISIGPTQLFEAKPYPGQLALSSKKPSFQPAFQPYEPSIPEAEVPPDLPDRAEHERQANVQRTLDMIDEALRRLN